MAFSLQARVVFPVDRPPIDRGIVAIDGELIAAVGTQPLDGELIDLGDVALLPGLVNAHTHLEFSHLNRPLGQPGMPLVDWIRLVIAERGSRTADPLSAIAAGLAESAQRGVTAIANITTADAAACVGISPIEANRFIEAIGFSRARADSAFAAVSARLDEPACTALGGSLGISPHAPYTVSPNLLRQLIDLARGRNLPVAMHVAESREELQFLRDGTGPFQELLDERSMWDASAVPHGSRPLDYLRMLAEAPRALVIHGNYLDAEEHAFLAAHRDRISLIYCPRTHHYFRHQPYPLAPLMSAGVRVALGTDSRASNPDLSVLAEMRHVARMHPASNPTDVLHMGTLAGAEALGRAGEIGSLTPGKHANLLAVPLAHNIGKTPQELLSSLLADQSEPRAAWLRGKSIFTT